MYWYWLIFFVVLAVALAIQECKDREDREDREEDD